MTKTIQPKEMLWLRFFVIAASIFTGSLTGATIDRLIVQFPAWQHLDVSAWEAYSRHGDLGNGIFLYPIEAIGGFLFLLGASITLIMNRSSLKVTAWPVYVATLLSLMGLFFTAFAAPVMLSLKTIGNDTAAIQHAFDKFYFWSLFRAAAQVPAFFVSLWAMANVFSTGSTA